MASKFNSTDRNLAQKEVERFFQTKLTPQKNFKKIFRNTDNDIYCILGGRGFWAGLTEKNFTFLQTETSKKILIFAQKEGHKIILFSGNLNALIDNKKLLTKTKENIYEFNFGFKNQKIYIKEIQNFYLKKITEFNINYSTLTETTNDFIDKFKQLSPERKSNIIKIISAQIQNKESHKSQ